jgi:DNA-binding MarR family transcriptional regulator
MGYGVMTEDAIRQEPALAALDDTTLAVRNLIGASQDLTVRMARVMRMNVTDMTAITLLTEHGPMGATELADRLGIRVASTTVLVDRLERAGHVERARDTVDRRRVTVTETAAARTASLSAWLPAIQEIDDVCRSLSDTERVFALDLLTRLTAAMERGGRS